MGEVLVPRISRLIGNKVWVIPVFLCLMAVLSETVVLVYVTFVPIFIPPFISLFNKYKVDRRMLVTVINAGLQIGYVCIPVGIGAVYMGIVQSAMAGQRPGRRGAVSGGRCQPAHSAGPDPGRYRRHCHFPQAP